MSASRKWEHVSNEGPPNGEARTPMDFQKSIHSFIGTFRMFPSVSLHFPSGTRVLSCRCLCKAITPKHSMYSIFTYIRVVSGVNVCKYAIYTWSVWDSHPRIPTNALGIPA